tara:strand:+ start:3006 stop:3446 length:441 start_codon:yes stop_codon:yes gene_type:complete
LSKPTITICIDLELMDIVKELQSRRQFSKFIQDALRSQRHIIESESLENELSKINEQIEALNLQSNKIKSKIDQVKAQEVQKESLIELELKLRELNLMKPQFEIWENLPMNKRPPSWVQWNRSRLETGEKLKALGYDFSRLKEDRN